MNRTNITSLLGLGASVVSMLLWVTFSFDNPYSNRVETDAAMMTFALLFLPACIAFAAALTRKRTLMAAAFVWSLPGSLYAALTPGIFALFGATSLAYFVAFLLMRTGRR